MVKSQTPTVTVWIFFLWTSGIVGVKACLFVLWQTGQARVGVGMSAVVCNQSNIEMLSQNRG